MKYRFRPRKFIGVDGIAGLLAVTEAQTYLLAELFQTPFSNNFKKYQFSIQLIRNLRKHKLEYLNEIDETSYEDYGIVGLIPFEGDVFKLIDWREYEEGKPYNGPVIILTGEELEKIFKHYLSILYQGVENNRYKVDETKVFDTDDDNPAYKLTEEELEDIYQKHKNK